MKQRVLLFRGSRERLKRCIQRKGGSILPERNFSLLWKSRYFKWGLSFRIRGSYTYQEDGILISYRFLPSLWTVLWVCMPLIFLLGFAFQEYIRGDYDSAGAVALYTLIFPGAAFWQAVRCHKEFCRYFQTATK